MNLKKLTAEFVANKTVLYRAPYDIGFKEENGQQIVKDLSRIEVTINTLKFLLENNCKIVVMTWVKRPEGIDPKTSTKPLAEKLAEMIGQEVKHLDDCIGDKVTSTIANLAPKEILMLENTRFYKEDYIDDSEFAKKLVTGMDVCVFDGFPQAHRAASSVTGILKLLPSCAGLYLEKEVTALAELRDNPTHPFTLIVGGAKISDKILAVKNLIEKCEHALIGGGTAHILLKELGYTLGTSLVEDVFVDDSKNKLNASDIAKELLSKYYTENDSKIVLPKDIVVSNSTKKPFNTRIADLTIEKNLGPSDNSLDIGPKTIEAFKQIIKSSKTIFWNGPMGAYDLDESFTNGTLELAEAVSEVEGRTIISGGDTIDAIKALGIENKITHISVAGGATLDFLAGLDLPALELLKNNGE